MAIAVIITSVVYNPTVKTLDCAGTVGGVASTASIDPASIVGLTVANIQLAIAIALAKNQNTSFPVSSLTGTVNI